MKQLVNKILLFSICLPLVSFSDFISYSVVKKNNNVIYDSREDKSNRNFFQDTFIKKEVLLTDTLSFKIFRDNECLCIHSYFITESTDSGEIIGNYLKEQKSYGPKSYTISLSDILNTGNPNYTKSIIWYLPGETYTAELARISFQ